MRNRNQEGVHPIVKTMVSLASEEPIVKSRLQELNDVQRQDVVDAAENTVTELLLPTDAEVQAVEKATTPEEFLATTDRVLDTVEAQILYFLKESPALSSRRREQLIAKITEAHALQSLPLVLQPTAVDLTSESLAKKAQAVEKHLSYVMEDPEKRSNILDRLVKETVSGEILSKEQLESLAHVYDSITLARYKPSKLILKAVGFVEKTYGKKMLEYVYGRVKYGDVDQVHPEVVKEFNRKLLYTTYNELLGVLGERQNYMPVQLQSEINRVMLSSVLAEAEGELSDRFDMDERIWRPLQPVFEYIGGSLHQNRGVLAFVDAVKQGKNPEGIEQSRLWSEEKDLSLLEAYVVTTEAAKVLKTPSDEMDHNDRIEQFYNIAKYINGNLQVNKYQEMFNGVLSAAIEETRDVRFIAVAKHFNIIKNELTDDEASVIEKVMEKQAKELREQIRRDDVFKLSIPRGDIMAIGDAGSDYENAVNYSLSQQFLNRHLIAKGQFNHLHGEVVSEKDWIFAVQDAISLWKPIRPESGTDRYWLDNLRKKLDSDKIPELTKKALLVIATVNAHFLEYDSIWNNSRVDDFMKLLESFVATDSNNALLDTTDLVNINNITVGVAAIQNETGVAHAYHSIAFKALIDAGADIITSGSISLKNTNGVFLYKLSSENGITHYAWEPQTRKGSTSLYFVKPRVGYWSQGSDKAYQKEVDLYRRIKYAHDIATRANRALRLRGDVISLRIEGTSGYMERESLKKIKWLSDNGFEAIDTLVGTTGRVSNVHRVFQHWIEVNTTESDLQRENRIAATSGILLTAMKEELDGRIRDAKKARVKFRKKGGIKKAIPDIIFETLISSNVDLSAVDVETIESAIKGNELARLRTYLEMYLEATYDNKHLQDAFIKEREATSALSGVLNRYELTAVRQRQRKLVENISKDLPQAVEQLYRLRNSLLEVVFISEDFNVVTLATQGGDKSVKFNERTSFEKKRLSLSDIEDVRDLLIPFAIYNGMIDGMISILQDRTLEANFPTDSRYNLEQKLSALKVDKKLLRMYLAKKQLNSLIQDQSVFAMLPEELRKYIEEVQEELDNQLKESSVSNSREKHGDPYVNGIEEILKKPRAGSYDDGDHGDWIENVNKLLFGDKK